MYQNNQQLIKASVIIVIIAGVLGALSIFTGGLDASSAKLFLALPEPSLLLLPANHNTKHLVQPAW